MITIIWYLFPQSFTFLNYATSQLQYVYLNVISKVVLLLTWHIKFPLILVMIVHVALSYKQYKCIISLSEKYNND